MDRKLPKTLDEVIVAYEYIIKQPGLTVPMRHLIAMTLTFLRELKEKRVE